MPGTCSRWIGALLAAGVLAWLGPAASGAQIAPGRLLAAALAAAGRVRSLHYVASSSAAGGSVTEVCDIGVAEGIQQISYRSGGARGHLTVIVAGGRAYVRGDAVALSRLIGLSAFAAAGDAGTWLSVPRVDPSYSSIAAAVTLASFIDELRLRAPFTSVPATIVGGTRAVGVAGGEPPGSGGPARGTLYLRAGAEPLPLREVAGTGALSSSVTISRWNEPLHIAIPTRGRSISGTVLA
jgi:hypothetical protein